MKNEERKEERKKSHGWQKQQHKREPDQDRAQNKGGRVVFYAQIPTGNPTMLPKNSEISLLSKNDAYLFLSGGDGEKNLRC